MSNQQRQMINKHIMIAQGSSSGEQDPSAVRLGVYKPHKKTLDHSRV